MPTSSGPRNQYQAIAEKLREKIRAGDWNTGTLPAEYTLAHEYNVSRDTLRRALSLLRTEGVIDSAQGYGSWVRQQLPRRVLEADRYRPLAKPGAGSVVRRAEGVEAISTGTLTSSAQHVTVDDLPTKLRRWMDGHAPDGLLRRDSTFSSAGVVQQHWTSWWPTDVVNGTLLAEPGTDGWSGTTVAALESVGWQRVCIHEEVWTRMPQPDEARRLHLPLGIPLLIAERVMHYARDGVVEPVEVAVVLLPGDRNLLINEFTGPST